MQHLAAAEKLLRVYVQACLVAAVPVRSVPSFALAPWRCSGSRSASCPRCLPRASFTPIFRAPPCPQLPSFSLFAPRRCLQSFSFFWIERYVSSFGFQVSVDSKKLRDLINATPTEFNQASLLMPHAFWVLEFQQQAANRNDRSARGLRPAPCACRCARRSWSTARTCWRCPRPRRRPLRSVSADSSGTQLRCRPRPILCSLFV